MDATLSYDNLLFEVDVDHSLEWSWAQFSPSIKIQFCVVAVGNVPVSTNFDVGNQWGHYNPPFPRLLALKQSSNHSELQPPPGFQMK